MILGKLSCVHQQGGQRDQMEREYHAEQKQVHIVGCVQEDNVDQIDNDGTVAREKDEQEVRQRANIGAHLDQQRLVTIVDGHEATCSLVLDIPIVAIRFAVYFKQTDWRCSLIEMFEPF